VRRDREGVRNFMTRTIEQKSVSLSSLGLVGPEESTSQPRPELVKITVRNAQLLENPGEVVSQIVEPVQRFPLAR